MVTEQGNAIARSSGTTDSERYLAKLGDQTFLKLWSYPNVFYDKKVGSKGDGKEACDLLAICGDHVLIFSDKSIAWPAVPDFELAWRRWFKRAVRKSADQIRGAQRWFREHPDRVFLDPQCTQPLPLPFPPIERRKVHGIVVALGAGEASKTFFKGGIGSLMINPSVRGSDHVRDDNLLPLTIGDVDPVGSFIHVFDDATLDIVMREMDTITDLTDYLTKKEQLIRSGNLIGATGEEELVAYYMTHMNSANEHDFTRPDGSAWAHGDAFALDAGHYSGLLNNPQYIAKKRADEESYVWDRLISAFTDNMLAGTTIVPDGRKFDLMEHEEGVRHMALASRYHRRLYGRGILEALEIGSTRDRMTRAFLPGPTETNQENGFFFMTLKVPDITLPGGYEQYRQVRLNMLEAYALTFLKKHPTLKRIVGIATEPLAKQGPKVNTSEDLILATSPEWSDDLVKSLEERQVVFDIAREGRYVEYAVKGNEFPEVPVATPSSFKRPKLNRQQRRALKIRQSKF